MTKTGWSVIGLLAVAGGVFAGAGFLFAQTAADADFNGNGEVDFQDFVLFARKFNTSEGNGDYEAKFDIDGNGSVGFTDFLTFARFFGETVPAPPLALSGIAPAEGMPGTLIELLGQFDANTTYQVKFDTVLLPVFAQNAERISVMTPVLSAASVPVRVVDASGRESEPLSFDVLALPEPRMNAGQLQQTVTKVGEGIGNVLAPLTAPDRIHSAADAASFNQEMNKLNAAWAVLGQRIAALPPEDAALLSHLLDNSGALEILEVLARVDPSASKVAAESRFAEHHALFQADIMSGVMGYLGDVTTAAAVAAFFVPEPAVTKAAVALLGTAGTIISVSKFAMDAIIPTDLDSLKVEITPTRVPAGGASDVAFVGNFSTESNLASELASEGLDIVIETVVKLVIKKRIPGGDALLENDLLDDALGEIIGYFSAILSAVGLEETGLQRLFPKVEPSRNNVPLDMAMYRLSPPNIVKWAIPRIPVGVITALELPFSSIDLVSESVEVVDGRDVVNNEVAVYDPDAMQLKGIKAGETRLKVRAFRFVEPESENRNLLDRLIDFVKNLHPLVRFFDSKVELPSVYTDVIVGDSVLGGGGPLAVESIRRLTRHEGDDTGPVWSPDGRHIAFVSDRDGNHEIYVKASSGSSPYNLTNHEGTDRNPVWSPDGRHIAFVSDRDGNSEIYVMGSDGSNSRNLSNHRYTDRSPVWSPDGRHIAFEQLHSIYVMGSDGSNPRNLANARRGISNYRPVWSPDGRHIAFETLADGNHDITVMGEDGSNRRNLTNARRGIDNNGPVWSADGRHIAFVSNRDGNSEIYVMGSDGSSPRNLTNNRRDDYGPVWSHDGRHIAFASDRDGNSEIYVMGSDGSSPSKLTNNSRHDYDPVWSPDGRHIAFASEHDSYGEIYVMTLQRADEGGETPVSPGADFVLDLDSNSSPRGITYANNRFYVVNYNDGKVYAYTSSGRRDSDADFELVDHFYPSGITYANDRFYVVDLGDRESILGRDEGNEKVYAYTSSGRRDPDADLELDDENTHPRGITYANNRFYVVDEGSIRGTAKEVWVYAYTSSGRRDTEADFRAWRGLTGLARMPQGITYANDRLYIVDDKVYAFTSSGRRDSFGDFEFERDDENNVPQGITYANSRFHIVTETRGDFFTKSHNKVLVYTSSGRRDSDADFELSYHDVDYGITYANNRFYIVTSEVYRRDNGQLYRNRVLSYTSSGQRDSDADFELDDQNTGVDGITYANNRFYVAQREKVYAYTSSGQRDLDADFELDVRYTVGITYANNRFHVPQYDKVYAYTSSGRRDSDADFDLHPYNRRPHGITYANDRFYIVDTGVYELKGDEKVYAYTGSGQPNLDAYFALDDDNTRPEGITYANNRLYVVDTHADKVYAYTLSGQ